jgi:K+-transporting ATPase ATPase C chain
MAVCVAGYALLILGIAQGLTPTTANGSLVADAHGNVIGSALIAQDFTAPGHFWPRPSAANYDASAAAGSNKSPTNPELAERAAETVARYGATAARKLPADLAATSGSGLDPHITLAGALNQVPRVATARGMPQEQLRALVNQCAFSPGGPLTDQRIVNVLMLNRRLDTAPARAYP